MHMICQRVQRIVEAFLRAQRYSRSPSVLAGTQQSFPAMMSASSCAAQANAQLITSNFCVLRMPDLIMNARHFQYAA